MGMSGSFTPQLGQCVGRWVVVVAVTLESYQDLPRPAPPPNSKAPRFHAPFPPRIFPRQPGPTDSHP